jgi:hypothetical protein
MKVVDAVCSARELDRDAKVLPPRAPRARSSTTRTTPGKAEAVRLLQQGATIEEVMEHTRRARSTVIGDLCELIEGGRAPSPLRTWVSEETEDQIRRAAEQAGIERLRPIKDIVGDAVSYDEIRIVVATLRGSDAERCRLGGWPGGVLAALGRTQARDACEPAGEDASVPALRHEPASNGTRAARFRP